MVTVSVREIVKTARRITVHLSNGKNYLFNDVADVQQYVGVVTEEDVLKQALREELRLDPGFDDPLTGQEFEERVPIRRGA